MSSPRSHLRSVVNQDGAAILDIDNGSIVNLNPTGGFVWERLEKGLSLDEIVRDLVRETGADAAIVAADVRLFVEQLAIQNLLL
jgi:Coenzyme PQQ synthesis protein D (PqqD)